MLNVKTDTIVVGVSELRTHLEEILEKMGHLCVAITKHNKVVGILLSVGQYEEMDQLLDMAEDIALGHMAKERERKKPARKYLSLEDVEKKVRASK